MRGELSTVILLNISRALDPMATAAAVAVAPRFSSFFVEADEVYALIPDLRTPTPTRTHVHKAINTIVRACVCDDARVTYLHDE